MSLAIAADLRSGRVTRHEYSSDVVVVGGGIIAAAVALRLGRGGHRVLIVRPEADDPGAASRAAGAMLGALGEVTVEPSTASEKLDLDLRLRAASRWQSWRDDVAELAIAPSVQRGTFVVLAAERPADSAAAEAMESIGAQAGLRTERVSPSDVPGLAPGGQRVPLAVLYLADEGWIDAPRLHDAVTAAAAATGNVSYVDDYVTALAVTTSGVAGAVTRNHGTVAAPRVVLCAGAQVGTILQATPDAGACPALLPAKGVGLRLTPPAGFLASPFRHAIRTPTRDFACGLHVLPWGDGAYLGATNRVTRWRGITGTVTAGEVARLVSSASRELYEPLSRWNVARADHGERPLSADGLPIVGPTGIDGAFVATGTYRNGVLLAPLVADLVARQIAGEAGVPEIGLGPSRAGTVRRPAAVLEAGLREYAQLLRDPDGLVVGPELDVLLATLGRLALERSAETDAVREQLRQVLTELPVIELVPEALIEMCHPELLSDDG